MTRTVIVTGGGTGLGAAMAKRFTDEGDTVFITGRRHGPLTRTAELLGDTVTPIICDHGDPEQLRQLADRLPDRIDVLINNAGGIVDYDGELTGLARIAASWHANLSANLVNTVLTTELLADRIAGGGSAIHLGSIAADKGGGAYGAAKAALATWNMDAAARLGQRGITSNVLAPGYTTETEFFGDSMTEHRHETLVTATRIGRPGTPEDVAGVAWFLASPDARNVTAQVLKVDGGAWPSR